MSTELMTGTLIDVKEDCDGNIVVDTSDASYRISTCNDCCGYSEFYLPNIFEYMLHKCKSKTIKSFERIDVDNIDEYCAGVIFGNNRPDSEEQENYIFEITVTCATSDEKLLFGLRF